MEKQKKESRNEAKGNEVRERMRAKRKDSRGSKGGGRRSYVEGVPSEGG